MFKNPSTPFRLALGAILSVCALLAVTIDWRQAFSTDLFDLLSGDETLTPEVQQVQSLLQTQLSREILVVVEPGNESVNSSTKADFLSIAERLDSFAAFTSLGENSIGEKTSAYLFYHRIELLFPKWLSRQRASLKDQGSDEALLDFLSKGVVNNLDQFLSQPESMAFEELLTRDPLLLIPNAIEQIGTSSVNAADSHVWLFSAQLSSPPTTHEVQHQLLTDIETLQNWLHQNLGPEAVLKETGFHRFAIESERNIRTEILRLNLLSLFLTISIAFIFLRKPWLLIPIVLVVISSVACALILTVRLMGQVHIIALVIGSILVGVAIDYCFHILLKREELRANSFKQSLRQIRTPLLTSCVSTMFGFLVLLSNPVSAIQQVGVFVSFGLGFALLLSTLSALAFDFPGEISWSRNLKYRFPLPSAPWGKWIRWGLTLGCAVIFFLFHRTRDNIEDLQISLTEAPANDAEVRSYGGGNTGKQSLWITMGSTVQEIIDHQQKLDSEVKQSQPNATLRHIASLLPTTQEIEVYLDFQNTSHSQFSELLKTTLEEGGYDSTAFEPFWNAWENSVQASAELQQWELLYLSIADQLQYPLTFLINGDNDRYWGTTQIQSSKALSLKPKALEHSFELAPLKALNQAFSSYRSGVTRSLWISMVVIALALFAVYRYRITLRIIQIPAMAVLMTLGIFTLLGEHISLFHLIGILLGTCITLDYAVFAAKSERGAYPISIRASALTTMASFAALSFSHIPAVMDLGTTVLTIAALGLIHTEFSLRPSLSDE